MHLMEHILAVRFSSLGDLVLLTGVFREIKKRRPACRITFLTAQEFVPLFEKNPHIDCIISYNRRGNTKYGLLKLVAGLRREKYTHILDFHKSTRSKLITLLMRITGYTGAVYRYENEASRETGSQREAYHRLVARIFSVSPEVPVNPAAELFPDMSAHEKINRLAVQHIQKGIAVAVAPGAAHDTKKWETAYYRDVMEHLHRKGITTLMIGGEGDPACRELTDYFKGQTLLKDLSGQLSYAESALAMKYCRAVICSDSAACHLAEAMGTPAVVLFGPTVKEFGYAPCLPKSRLLDIPLPCRPCSANGKKRCTNPEFKACLRGITPDRVLATVTQIISDTENAPGS
ncbi:hypothetical protein CHS0354_006821 [Potamilus streckersoni]|uniref:Glycosyltransferase family 9 protein n=1 Tax=Potamilus streckersoni TaxID=2493646 RepID=A0AAE0TE76_9BIVA|nr:hypothetical protein CHS0354_006821 [Potamilus streckersoni]